jgi:uncharacterized membrane protein YdjX (TVP38/TMEM64 family)
MKRSHILKILGGFLVIAVLVSLNHFFPFTEYLTKSTIEAYVTQFGIFAPVVYGVIYFILILLFISATVFTVLAGTLFGSFTGIIVVVIAATAAAAAAFGIARLLGKDAVDKLMGAKNEGFLKKWIVKIDNQCEHNSFLTFFILRCSFLPYIPLSYVAGLIRGAKFWEFTLATFITNLIFSSLFVLLGASLFSSWKGLIITVILIALSLQIPKVIALWQKKKEQVLK